MRHVQGRENSEALLALCSLEMMVGERKLGECSGCAVTTRVARPASHVIVTRGPIRSQALASNHESFHRQLKCVLGALVASFYPDALLKTVVVTAEWLSYLPRYVLWRVLFAQPGSQVNETSHTNSPMEGVFAIMSEA